MSDDDFLFDWPLIQTAARAGPRTGGGRQGGADRGEQRRSPPAAPGAKMIPFPASRRVGEIRRLAGQIARLSHKRGEAHLCRQLRQKADALRRRGFSERQILREIASMEAAVRSEHRRREFEGRPAG